MKCKQSFRRLLRCCTLFVWCAGFITCGFGSYQLSAAQASEDKSDFFYIDTSFENASPLWWEIDGQGSVQVYLNYDQERESPNRANGHWHFKVQAAPGSKHTLVLNHLNNVWNGKPGVPVSDLTVCKVSEDGESWRTIHTEIIHTDQLRFEIELGLSSELLRCPCGTI
jgi:hypothetical protein